MLNEKKILQPMLCELSQPFDSPDYIFETKYDGIRAIIEVTDQGLYQIQARSGADKTHLFPEFNFKTRYSCLLDGEIVCKPKEIDATAPNMGGNFNAVQHRTNRINGVQQAVRDYPATYMAFDLLAADGIDLKRQPLMKRKELLRAVLTPTENVLIGTYIEEHGIQAFEQAKAEGAEGIVGKLKTGFYVPGKRIWLKCKTWQEDEFVICGYTAGTGWRATTFGALVLGKETAGKDIIYVGSVGTGFNDRQIDELYVRMNGLKGNCVFYPVPKDLDRPTWIRPEVKCKVKFLEYTGSDGSGLLRFPSYQGMVS